MVYLFWQQVNQSNRDRAMSFLAMALRGDTLLRPTPVCAEQRQWVYLHGMVAKANGVT